MFIWEMVQESNFDEICDPRVSAESSGNFSQKLFGGNRARPQVISRVKKMVFLPLLAAILKF